MAVPGGRPSASRATYAALQRWVRQHYGFWPLPAWIAHVKALEGLRPRRAANRRGARRTLCPPEKRAAIVAALRHFSLAGRRSAESR